MAKKKTEIDADNLFYVEITDALEDEAVEEEALSIEAYIRWGKRHAAWINRYFPQKEQIKNEALAASNKSKKIQTFVSETMDIFVFMAAHRAWQYLSNVMMSFNHDAITSLINECLTDILEDFREDQKSEITDTEIIPTYIPTTLTTLVASTVKPEICGLWDVDGAMGMGEDGITYTTGKKGVNGVMPGIMVGLDFTAMADDPLLHDVLQRLDVYDKRVHRAVCTLYDDDYRVGTINDVAYLAGIEPTGKARERIELAMLKMAAVRIYVDNTYEQRAHYRYAPISRWGQLLPISGKWVYVRGKKTKAYAILERPILLELAEQRQQISKIPIEAIKTPYRQSELSMLVESVLLDVIIGMKNRIKAPGMWVEYSHVSLLDRCGYSDARGETRKRLIGHGNRYLEYLASFGFINDTQKDVKTAGQGKKWAIQLRAPKQHRKKVK